MLWCILNERIWPRRRRPSDPGSSSQDANQCGAERSVVPSAEPRGDAVWPYTETIGRFEQSIECVAGIFGRVLLAGEPLLFVIADEPYSPLAGCLHERD